MVVLVAALNHPQRNLIMQRFDDREVRSGSGGGAAPVPVWTGGEPLATLARPEVDEMVAELRGREPIPLDVGPDVAPGPVPVPPGQSTGYLG